MKRLIIILMVLLGAGSMLAQTDTVAMQHKADSIYALVQQKYAVGDYRGALDLLLEAEPIDEVLSGVEYHAEYITNLGTIYFYIGETQNAVKYYIKASEFLKKNLGEKNSSYAQALSNVGLLYTSIGEYPKAQDFYAQASEIFKKINDTESIGYASLLTNIGVVNYYLGYYLDAIDYYQQSLEIRKKTIGETHPDYATGLNNIGLIYELLGDYKNALDYYLHAAEIWKKSYGEDNRDYLTAISNIALLYDKIGDYQKSLKYNLQVLEIRKRVLGEEHSDYARSLNNIGNAYLHLEDYQKSLQYYQQALEIRKKSLGENHPDYATSLNNVGVVYSYMDDYKTALKYYRTALELRENIFGTQHPLYAESANNVGLAYQYFGENDTAIKYFNEALEIQANVLGTNHNDYALTLNNISSSYYKMSNMQKAVMMNGQALAICRNNLVRNFSFMTAHEREAYWSTHKTVFNNGLRYSFGTKDTLAAPNAYNIELIIKGLLLASEISLTNIIMESGDKALIAEYNDLKKMNLALNEELEKSISERTLNCDSLAEAIQKKERHLIESSKEFGDATNFININWKDVQNSMKDNDVAIEFTLYDNLDTDTTKYAAIVLTKDMESPVFVPLFNDKDIARMLRGLSPAKPDAPSDDRGATTVASKRQGIYESTSLYNALWKPLEKYFPENPRIYFAPLGELYQIAVEYAPVDHDRTISDKYEMYRVSSTRFLAMDYMPRPLKNTVLYGGIYYDADTTTMKQESDRYSTRSVSISSFSDLNKDESRGSLNYLPGTKTEVEDILGKLKKKRIKSQLYEGSAANEESFKALSGKDIEILHIATHGFFLPTDEKLSGDQSLIQSGLLLSGANYAWQNKPLPEGIEDGILTAKEISYMDLRKTDLVVLSACQTALGEITGEGVFGLQRGFKKAGARTIIMSLWPVDDNATLLMMTEFYSNLVKGMSKREAFLDAQNKVKGTKGFENPRFWAAFIMLDGNEN